MTQYLDPTGTEMWERSSRGRCVWCGEFHESHCYVRFCDWCTRYWMAATSTELDEIGPRFEACPECVAWELAGRPQECVALVKFNPCVDCGTGTVGSYSPAVGFVKCICQNCRNASNARLDAACRAFARTFDLIAA